ncbi:hypothetical protein [Subtercola sp. YIM 133946]|uniref:hypothetical protein n=1 Tax=Subtercola sp. YIM 133946 TaxID=3118909 RepID=UPI002F944468
MFAATGVATFSPRTRATTVPGLRVAGTVTDPMAQVVSSAAAGLMAGVAMHADLLAEETTAAVAALHAR